MAQGREHFVFRQGGGVVEVRTYRVQVERKARTRCGERESSLPWGKVTKCAGGERRRVAEDGQVVHVGKG